VITAATNKANTQNAMDNWMLGPMVPGVKPSLNKDYWQELAAAWLISEAEARRRLCSNCEYYDNTPETKAEMEAIPLNSFDVGAGSRGFCTKLDFICHDIRVCLAWDRKDFMEEGNGSDGADD